MVLAGNCPPKKPLYFTSRTHVLTIMCLVAVLRGESKVTGEVQFEQTSEDAPTKITYNLTGLDPSAKRGFHVQ
jgi:hypothetical protein